MDADNSARTRAFYDTVAGAYAQMIPDTTAESPLDLGVVDHFIAVLPASHSPVLDAGCGTGRMLTYLADHGVRNRVGVDLSDEMLAFARRSHPGTPLEVADLRSLPVADGSMRGVLCWYSIIHSTTEEVALIAREVARVLEPGAPAAFGFQAGVGERVVEGAYGHDITLHGVLHSTSEVAEALIDAGLEIVLTADRRPFRRERNPAGFVIARRPDPAATQTG